MWARAPVADSPSHNGRTYALYSQQTRRNCMSTIRHHCQLCRNQTRTQGAHINVQEWPVTFVHVCQHTSHQSCTHTHTPVKMAGKSTVVYNPSTTTWRASGSTGSCETPFKPQHNTWRDSVTAHVLSAPAYRALALPSPGTFVAVPIHSAAEFFFLIVVALAKLGVVVLAPTEDIAVGAAVTRAHPCVQPIAVSVTLPGSCDTLNGIEFLPTPP